MCWSKGVSHHLTKRKRKKQRSQTNLKVLSVNTDIRKRPLQMYLKWQVNLLSDYPFHKRPLFCKPQSLWMRCIWCKVIICSTLCCLYDWIAQGGRLDIVGENGGGGGDFSSFINAAWGKRLTASVLLGKKKPRERARREGNATKKHLSDGPNGSLWSRLLVQSVWEEQMTSLNSRRDKGKAALVLL